MATEYITVTTTPPLNVMVETQTTNLTVEQPGVASLTIGGGVTMPDRSVVVSNEDPQLSVGGIWVQTFNDGDFTMWIEDGT